MFSHMCVIHSVHSGGMHDRGAWVGDAWGLHVGTWECMGEVCMGGGACVGGGMHGVCMAGVVHGRGGACVAGETATAADGMDPTGMLSCLHCNHNRTNCKCHYPHLAEPITQLLVYAVPIIE